MKSIVLIFFNGLREKCGEKFKESTWLAFWKTAIHHEKPDQVADGLGLSLGAIYVARSRVAARLKVKIESLTHEWPEFGLSQE